MISRIFNRHVSTVRKGKKGHSYVPEPHPPVRLSEQVRILKRRIEKAERDERMDISTALTPVKTYMGGFTRPKDLRMFNWFHGGRYSILKSYESPPRDAYEPHTVFLLESRYPGRHGVGRIDCREYIIGVCKADKYHAVMQKFNSERCPRVQSEFMDNARWPWLPQKRLKRPVWWFGAKGEIPSEIYKRLYDGEDVLLDNSPPFEDDPNENVEGSIDSSLSLSEDDQRRDHTTDTESKVLRPPKSPPPTAEEVHAQYVPTLSSNPFWRPILTLTVSTRPIALSISRLAKSLPRGMAFYASLPTYERLSYLSFNARMRCLRIDRMSSLALETAKRLAGYYGGFLGIRFGIGERGRGVDGEGLADPIPYEKRIIHIGIGEWYYRSDELKEWFETEQKSWFTEDSPGFSISMLDEKGRKLDDHGVVIQDDTCDNSEATDSDFIDDDEEGESGDAGVEDVAGEDATIEHNAGEDDTDVIQQMSSGAPANQIERPLSLTYLENLLKEKREEVQHLPEEEREGVLSSYIKVLARKAAEQGHKKVF